MTDINDAEDLHKLLLKSLDVLSNAYDQKFLRLEEAQSQLEQQVAALTAGYTDIAAILETLTSITINRSEEDKEEFFKTLALSRKRIIETLQYGISLAEEQLDKFTAHAPGPDAKSQPDKGVSNE